VAAVKADKNLVEVASVPRAVRVRDEPHEPPFSNRALRQAAISALDIEQIVKGVWLGVGVPSNGPIPPSSWAYDSSILAEKRDLAKVKAKFAEGGQPSGFSFTLTTNNIPINVQEAEVMQAQLAEAGITMKTPSTPPLSRRTEQQERDDQLPVERPARP
jgi:ABC-type transport system substrate-binding protein